MPPMDEGRTVHRDADNNLRVVVGGGAGAVVVAPAVVAPAVVAVALVPKAIPGIGIVIPAVDEPLKF